MADHADAVVVGTDDGGIVAVDRGAIPAGSLLRIGSAIGHVLLAVALHLGAELGVVRELEGDRRREAVLLIAGPSLIGFRVLAQEVEAHRHAADTVVRVEGRAVAAEAVQAGAGGGGAMVQSGLFARAALKSTGTAVAEERGIGPPGKIEALRVISIRDEIIDRTVAHGEIAVAVNTAETRLKSVAAEGPRFAADGRIRANRPSQGLVHVGEIEILEKFFRHHGDRSGRNFQRGIGPTASEGAAAKITAVLVGGHFEGREENGVRFPGRDRRRRGLSVEIRRGDKPEGED